MLSEDLEELCSGGTLLTDGHLWGEFSPDTTITAYAHSKHSIVKAFPQIQQVYTCRIWWNVSNMYKLCFLYLMACVRYAQAIFVCIWWNVFKVCMNYTCCIWWNDGQVGARTPKWHPTGIQTPHKHTDTLQAYSIQNTSPDTKYTSPCTLNTHPEIQNSNNPTLKDGEKHKTHNTSRASKHKVFKREHKTMPKQNSPPQPGNFQAPPMPNITKLRLAFWPRIYISRNYPTNQTSGND